MTSLFPFVSPQSHYMQRSVVGLIENSSFVFRLPVLTDKSWAVVNHPSAERERLEFLGDALVGSCVSEELFRCRPNEGPGFYTIARSVLTANSTFAHLMRKVGLFRPGDLVKPAGDAFETILAAYHGEKGPDAFKAYVRTYFVPLIYCISKAYDRYRKNRFRTRKNLSFALDSQRRRLDHARAKFRAKVRKQSTKQVKTARPHKSFPAPSATRSLKASPVVIDLTDCTSDDEDAAPCRITQSPADLFRASTSSASSHFEAPLDGRKTTGRAASQVQKNTGNAVTAHFGMLATGVYSAASISTHAHTPWLSSTRGSQSVVAPFSITSGPQAVGKYIGTNFRPNAGQASVLGASDNPILID